MPLYKEKGKTCNVSGNKIQPGTTRNAPKVASPHKEVYTAWVHWDMMEEDKEGEEEEEQANMQWNWNLELGNKVVDEEPLSAVKHRRRPALTQEPREDNVSVTEQKITIKKGNLVFRVTRASITNSVSTNLAWALHCMPHRRVARCNGAPIGFLWEASAREVGGREALVDVHGL